MKLLPSRRFLCTPYNHAPRHFTQSHILKVHACLALTRHLHFWQNNRDFLRATAVTRGWDGYRYKSQHRKLTLEKKIFPPLLQGFEPSPFQSRVRLCYHCARGARVLQPLHHSAEGRLSLQTDSVVMLALACAIIGSHQITTENERQKGKGLPPI